MDDESSVLNFFAVIHNHLHGIAKLATYRQDMTPHTDALLSYLHPYIDEKVNEFKNDAPSDEYKLKIHKVKTAMLALHRIGVIPEPSEGKKDRVYSEYDKEKDKDEMGISHGGISNRKMFRQLMMKYFSLLSELTFMPYDMQALEFSLDVGYAILTPYITEEDKQKWKMSNMLSKIDNYSAMKKKMQILSTIMDREGFLFQRRFIDEMTVTSIEEYEEELDKDESELYSQ